MAMLVARMGEKRDEALAVGELEERDHVEELDVHGRKTLKEDGGMKWIYLAQDWGKWRDILKAVKKLWVT